MHTLVVGKIVDDSKIDTFQNILLKKKPARLASGQAGIANMQNLQIISINKLVCLHTSAHHIHSSTILVLIVLTFKEVCIKLTESPVKV
jgi:hypothetical protein